MTEYYLISKEDIEKIHCPIQPSDIDKDFDKGFMLGYESGKQAILSKAQKGTPAELIQQLYPEIEKIIVKWITGEAVVINSRGNILAKRTKPFTDYLTE